jgi:hypothetical protein
VNENARLCGDVLSVGTAGTDYNISFTNLGNSCPPCCEDLRRNPVFCCLERRMSPAALADTCRECN